MNENLLATVNALRSSRLKRPGAWEPSPYRNRRLVWGTCVSFWNADQYHMISVHNCSSVLTPSILAFLIEGIESIDELRFGVYANQKNIPGFYATARSTRALDGSLDHWFMIARSPERNFAQIMRGKTFMSEDEQDVLSYLESTADLLRLPPPGSLAADSPAFNGTSALLRKR
jgi:hypothetical protein